VTDAIKTVFVIDDDESTRRSLTRLLVAEGYDVRVFADGRAFLGARLDSACACAIVDLRMPIMDGLTLYEEMRVHRIRYPVIFLSAYGTVTVATQAMKS